MHIEMGDNGRYSMTRIGTITFHREVGSPFRLKDVMYASVLKKNLVSIMVLENCGYNLIFNKRKDFLRHIIVRKVKQAWDQVKNLYKLDVEGYAALSTKAEKVQS